jgi:hypothetical protein
MKIREGAYYRTRGGHVFGPMVWDKDPTINYPWHIVSTENVCWDKRGFWLVAGTSQLDLISEVYVSDTPPALANIRVGGGGGEAPAPEAKTLRDKFASDWMKAVLANPDHADGDMESFACMAYRMADAMMEAREK